MPVLGVIWGRRSISEKPEVGVHARASVPTTKQVCAPTLLLHLLHLVPGKVG